MVTEEVQAALERFQTQHSGTVNRALERARRYGAMIRSIFREAGLPEDLISLAVIESGMRPHAVSPSSAVGLWQFVATTARDHGLRIGPWVDERRDPEKSTRTAAVYLRSLFNQFRSWPLALAAYNAGAGRVADAVATQRTTDVSRLSLPAETRRFLPAVFAMTLILRRPERYGFSRPPDEPYDTEFVRLERPVDISTVAQHARTSVAYLRELNPELLRETTPPNHPRYPLRVPKGAAHLVRRSLQKPASSLRIGGFHRPTRPVTAEARPATLADGGAEPGCRSPQEAKTARR